MREDEPTSLVSQGVQFRFVRHSWPAAIHVAITVLFAITCESRGVQADEAVDDLRLSSELTVGGVDLLPGQWLTTEVLTIERPTTSRVSVFASVPAAVTWSRTDDAAAVGNVTLGARADVARGPWSDGATEVQVTAVAVDSDGELARGRRLDGVARRAISRRALVGNVAAGYDDHPSRRSAGLQPRTSAR